MRVITRDIVDCARDPLYFAIGFTANAYVSQAGALVMGRGAAAAIKNAFPRVPHLLGACLVDRGGSPGGVQADYHTQSVDLLLNEEGQSRYVELIAVQVKRHFRDQDDPVAKAACFELTRTSLEVFNAVMDAQAFDNADGRRAAINFPLIGNGGYDRRDVEALVRSTLWSGCIDVLLK